MPPKLCAPSDVKKAQPDEGLDWLLDVFIEQLEDRVTSSGCVDPRVHPAQCSSPPSSLLSHSVPLPCGRSCGLAHLNGPDDHGPDDFGTFPSHTSQHGKVNKSSY